MKFLKIILSFLFISSLLIACSKDENSVVKPIEQDLKELTIFHINDQHGNLENFSKIKYIVDQEKLETNVMLVCSGDIFSGNPVVDNYEQKGFPMIDVMNKVGFDISVVGNHEFDYGEAILKDRFQQSNFDWVCANVEMNSTGIPAPFEYKTITSNNVKVTFLGLIETNGKENDVIPSTHPWRVQNLTFTKYQDVVANYSNVKTSENSDLYIALTHLGTNSDEYIANNFPYFDAIIGGHSHAIVNNTTNNIPVFQAGSNLRYLGKIMLTLQNKKIESLHYQLIDLDNYSKYDQDLKEVIDTYNSNANLDEVIGYSEAYHSKSGVGSFYTDVLRQEMDVDISFQNPGGIRNTLDEGDILKHEIYSIDPFNNGSVIYSMTVREIKDFLKGTKSAVYYSGVEIAQENQQIIIYKNNQELSDSTTLTIGLNDYIPAVYDNYFTQTPTELPYTTAEGIINYLNNHSNPINYSQINRYFRYQ